MVGEACDSGISRALNRMRCEVLLLLVTEVLPGGEWVGVVVVVVVIVVVVVVVVARGGR